MQFSEIDSYITTRFQASLSSTYRKEHINEVYIDLAKLFTKGSLATSTTITTSTTASEYTLGKGAVDIKHVYATISSKKTGLREIVKEAIVYPLTSGVPTCWSRSGTTQSTAGENRLKFILDPKPNSIASTASTTGTVGYALSVEYEPVPAKLTGTDVPKYIPNDYHHLIAWGAMAVIASQQEDSYAAQLWETRFRDGVNEMILKLGLEVSR